MITVDTMSTQQQELYDENKTTLYDLDDAELKGGDCANPVDLQRQKS
jgi:hypothetical protein